MSQSASEKLSQRWGSRRQENNSRGRSNWGSTRNNLLEKLVTVDESVVGRIIGARGANIRAMEQEISSREGGMCRIHSVRGVKGGTFLVKGSHTRILEVAEQWLLKYQQQYQQQSQQQQSQQPNERHVTHMLKLEQQEKLKKQEAEKLRLSKIAPDINTQNFPSFSSKPTVTAIKKAETETETETETVEAIKVAVAKETPKWGDCGSLRNAVQGLTIAQKQKKTQESTEKWYPDSMVLLPIEKPVSFYDN